MQRFLIIQTFTTLYRVTGTLYKREVYKVSMYSIGGLSGIQIAFENQTIRHPTSFTERGIQISTLLNFRNYPVPGNAA